MSQNKNQQTVFRDSASARSVRDRYTNYLLVVVTFLAVLLLCLFVTRAFCATSTLGNSRDVLSSGSDAGDALDGSDDSSTGARSKSAVTSKTFLPGQDSGNPDAPFYRDPPSAGVDKAMQTPPSLSPATWFIDFSLRDGLVFGLLFVIGILTVYGIRHYLFTLNRLFCRQRHPYIDIEFADWPHITVFIAAHNEEKVVAGCIEALLNTNYPPERMRIVPVNDRSTDRTREIIDSYVEANPGRIEPFHRTSGKPGKAAALKDALPYVRGDVVLIFDADYVPGRGLLKQLAAPFFDPEVGAVMGRVVPMNAGTNLLTRMLDLERSGGYQVDQQARMNLGLVPQYGGTVGGIRVSAMEAVGGWRDDTLAEDTDITYRLLMKGWKTVYSNRSECYEEVPEEWRVRIKQVKRWSKGHNQVMVRYALRFLTCPELTLRQRVDGLLLMLIFIMPPLLLLSWIMALLLYFCDGDPALATVIPPFALMSFGTQGNFAAFYEIVFAVILDGNRKRLRLLPLNLLGFFISMFSISHATWQLFIDGLLKREMVWDKTVRYRSAAAEPVKPSGQ